MFTRMDMDFLCGYRIISSLKFIEHWMELLPFQLCGDKIGSIQKNHIIRRMRYPNEYKCDYNVFTKFDKDYKNILVYQILGCISKIN